MIDREEFIIERCAGKKVLHIGCCATPACREESEKGTLLHLNLAKSASELWGLDMSREDITFLQDQYQIENLVVGDAELIDKSFPPGAFDVIVAGELIEHLRNPGLFLVGAPRPFGPRRHDNRFSSQRDRIPKRSQISFRAGNGPPGPQFLFFQKDPCSSACIMRLRNG